MAFSYLAQPKRFFNRTHELAALQRGFTTKAQPGQLLLLYGRRRLGKTFLLQRFFAGAPGETPKRHCYYLADQTTAYAQRRALAEQLLDAFPDPGASPDDLAVSWNALLRFVTQQAQGNTEGERVTLILDEFPYLVQQTPELSSILQSWWDREGIHSRLFVVLCGSHLSAMKALGAASAPLFGRFNAGILALAPLGYQEVADFYKDCPEYDVRRTLSMYGVFGGTPRYHALVDTDRPFGEELVNLLLRPGGALENEVSYLLSSEQIREPAPYNAVLGAIALGETQFGGIMNALGMDRGGLSYYLSTLTELGWIRRELPFEEQSERRSLYQVTDPFLTFWYRCIRPLASAVSFADPQALFENRIIPQLSAYMGRYVFENICHQWLQKQAETTLGISLLDAGRWWSRDGQIELDVVAKRASGGYLFGECKWSATSPVGMDVYTQLLGKVARHPETRWREGASYVLFSLGGFTSELQAVAAGSSGGLHLVGPESLLPVDRVSS
jgi:AAA+ ATPase superfamily predicted ATPase